MFKKIIPALMAAVLLVACSASQPQNQETGGGEPYPQPGETSGGQTGGEVQYPEPGNPDQAVSPGSTPGTNPYPSPLDPIPGEEAMDHLEIVLDSSELLTLESFPPQFNLLLKGSLPTPCAHLRAKVSSPDDQNRIQIELYALDDPVSICAQVFSPFQSTISLGSFPDGEYSVWINGKQVGAFKTP